MGFLDDAKKFLDEHDDRVDQAIEKAGDLIDEKTGDKYADKVDKVQDIAEEKTGDGDTAR
ncbi:MAG TPA: antitoxin [Nocardioides sp.]|uniref:antitoxin n=1 Tax=Nocardioides sp. TaxID=35761 RepID=UPI002F3F454B